MKLVPGARLGPYEILGAVGAGGMGEVYRAHDPRLDRDVALKIVAAGDHGHDRLRRFEQEAQAVAALNHPHILAVFDVGSTDGTAYVVFELLEGQTLRERLDAGEIPPRKAVEYGAQIARGLAAAHARGIIHRDLKPANLFVTRGGPIKILDFGLAKLNEPVDSDEAHDADGRTATDSGLVLGTAGYLSPEQARGRKADARSDIFALGAVLYEMVAGRPAFGGDSSADRVSAILSHDPPELVASGRENVSSGLDRIIRRCLEKDPEERFQSARDVAFALEAQGSTGAQAVVAPAAAWRMRLAWLGAAVVACAAFAAIGPYAGRPFFERPLPTIRSLTSGRGSLSGARFLPGDDRTVVYSASWDGKPNEIFSIHLDSPGSRSLGLPPAKLLSVSSRGELAILLTRPDEVGDPFIGTLARVPLTGGTPRAVLENVEDADWSPDGRELAVVRVVDGKHQLEYPLGQVLLRSSFGPGVHAMRVSPRGDKVAISVDEAITIVDRQGNQKSLGALPWTVVGLAWSPDGDAVLVTVIGHVWRLGLDGSRRELYRSLGTAVLHDVGPSGGALLHHGSEHWGLRVKFPGASSEREVASPYVGVAYDFTADGTRLLVRAFDNAYLLSADDSEPVLIHRMQESSDGWAQMRLSPDGRWLLDLFTQFAGPSNRARVLAVGAGEQRDLPLPHLQVRNFMFVDSERFYWMAEEPPGSAVRGLLQEIATGKLRAVTPAGITPLFAPAVDGAVLGLRASDGRLVWCPLDGGDVRPTAALVSGPFETLQGSLDGRWVYARRDGIPMPIEKIDLKSGARGVWKHLAPPDRTGVVLMPPWAAVAPDGEAYAYSYLRVSQDLFVLEGLK